MDDEPSNVLQAPLVIINLGVQAFGESLSQQGVEVTQVDWSPPAEGDQEMIELLDKLL